VSKSPFFNSAMVEAWLEGKDAEPTGKISSPPACAVAFRVATTSGKRYRI